MQRLTPPETGLSLFLCDIAEGQEHHGVGRHRHEEHEVVLGIGGSACFRLDDGSALAFSAGDILVMHGGMAHELRVDGAVRFCGFRLHPSVFLSLANIHPGDSISRMTQLVSPLPPFFAHHPPTHHRLLELFYQTQAEFTRADRWQHILLTQIGQQVAIVIGRLRQEEPHAAEDSTLRRVLAVRDWMDSHFLEPLRLPDLAEMAHLSPSRFSALFHQAVSLSPKAYLLRRRLEHAAHLLAATELRVSQIAWELGFTHHENFTHAFKRHTGMNPTDYREQHRKNNQGS